MRHQGSKKHEKKSTSIITASESSLISAVPGIASTSTSSTFSRGKKEIDIRMTAFMIEYNVPLRLAKPLNRIIKKCVEINPEAAASNNIGRTKCTVLMKTIGNYSKFLLLDELRFNKFSILIDESTDYSSIKQLALVTSLTNVLHVL